MCAASTSALPARTIKFADINIFVGAVIFARLIYCSVSLCGGGRITANISPPYRTKIEYFIRRRGINNSYSRSVFSGQLKSFCRIDDISYARGSSDTSSACDTESYESATTMKRAKSSSRFSATLSLMTWFCSTLYSRTRSERTNASTPHKNIRNLLCYQ